MVDLRRSIPSMVDGLTSDERKILFCAFKKPISKGTYFTRFRRYVSRYSLYPDGEQSLLSAILCMSMGSSNVNLLYQTNSMKTRVSPITWHIFHKADEPLLNYLNENGQFIEPTWYIPIIPMVLVNGSEWVGQGCASFVPRYNPRDIIANLKRLLKDEDVVPMSSWYRLCKRKEKEPFFEEYNEMVLGLPRKKAKLCTNYMQLLDPNGALKKYEGPEQILEDFANLRLEFYEKRKSSLLHKLHNDVKQVENKVRFIGEVCDGEIIPQRGAEAVLEMLRKRGYLPFPTSDAAGKPIPGTEYDYLKWAFAYFMFGKKTLQQLEAEKDAKQAEWDELSGTSPKSLWLRDLDALEKQLDEQDKRNDDGEDDDDEDVYEKEEDDGDDVDEDEDR